MYFIQVAILAYTAQHIWIYVLKYLHVRIHMYETPTSSSPCHSAGEEEAKRLSNCACSQTKANFVSIYGNIRIYGKLTSVQKVLLNVRGQFVRN